MLIDRYQCKGCSSIHEFTAAEACIGDSFTMKCYCGVDTSVEIRSTKGKISLINGKCKIVD